MTNETTENTGTSGTAETSDGNPTESRDSEFGSQSSQAAQEEVGDVQTSPEHNEETLGASTPTDGDPSLIKDPSDWVSGDDPATSSQKSYLDTLARQAGEELPADISKADASIQIDRLRFETGKDS